MNKATCRISAALAALLLSQAPQLAGANTCDLTIGVSLHPYYSWVKNIVGDAAEVTTLIPPDVDPHTYQPTAADMARLEGLDVVVVNGVGHDEFITPMLKAIDNPKLTVLDTSKGLPLIPSFGDRHYAFEEQEGGGAAKVSYNSHTYIAVNGAVQQMQMLNRELGKLCPEQATQFTSNLREYAAKLRTMLQESLSKIHGLKMDELRIATVHDGYSYLFQELGIEVSAVVQPRHGVTPSSKQLQDTIKRIKQAKVNILFGELDYEKKYVDIIFQETGCRLYALSHISNGEYSKEHFEQTMKTNMDIIVKALTEAAGRSGAVAAPASVQEVMTQQMQGTAQQMQGTAQQMQGTAQQMQEKMRQEMQSKMQQAVPGIQQKQMQDSMSKQAQQVQGAMQQNVQQAVQMQDAAKQMQEKMRQEMQNKMQQAVPGIQQKQMQDSMSKQAQQVQGAMQQNVQQAVPAVQQQQMSQQMQDTAKKMQESMQKNMQNAVPEIQQKQMDTQMQKAVEQVQQNLPTVPAPAAEPQAKP